MSRWERRKGTGGEGGRPWGTRGCGNTVIIYVYEMDVGARGGNKMDGK